MVSGFGVYAAAHAAGGFAIDYMALRKAGLKREQAIARVAGLGVLEYAVLAPVALVCALLLFVGSGDHVQDSMTLPWLAVIPGFGAALWASSPKRRERLTDPIRAGRVRGSVAHAIAGLVTLRRRREPLWILLSPIVLVTIASVIGYGTPRFRHAAEIPLLVFGGVAVTRVLDWAQAHGWARPRRSAPRPAAAR